MTIPKRHVPTNVFPFTDFRLKRLKKSPLPFQNHKAILQPDHNTNPKSSHTTTTTTKPPPLNPEITQKTQPNSTNTPFSLAVASTPANTATTTTNHTVSTSYTSSTTTTTNTTRTQTDTPIPDLMQLNIPTPSRIHTPSTSITIPLSPSIAPSSIAASPIFPRTLQDLQRLGLWGPPCHPIDNQRRLPSPGDFKVTSHPTNGQTCMVTHTIIAVFVQSSSQY